jgi:hypothetical protein
MRTLADMIAIFINCELGFCSELFKVKKVAELKVKREVELAIQQKQ